jgi:hypothetical protein
MIFELPLGDAENPSKQRVWELMRQRECLETVISGQLSAISGELKAES